MQNVARFPDCKLKSVLLALAILCAKGACAAPNGDAAPQKMDCKIYEQQEQANLAVQMRADPAIHNERLDTVFYSASRNSCLASVYFTKRETTYAGIVDIVEGRMFWAKSYRGTKFSPTQIVAMNEEMDDEIKALETAPAATADSHAFDFLPLLFDRTMNAFPAIKNALTEP